MPLWHRRGQMPHFTFNEFRECKVADNFVVNFLEERTRKAGP